MAVFDNLNYTHSEGVAPSVIQYYDRAVLPNMMPEMVHHRDAQKRTLPLNNGKTVQFRRITALPPLTKPLVEGVTPEGQKMTETAFTAMVKPYGGHIEVTDEYNFYLLGNKHREAAETLANQASLSLDTLDAMSLNAGLNVQYAGGKTTRGALTAEDKVGYADIKKMVRTLRRANARPFSDGFFHGIMHTDVYFDLTSDPMWIDVATYQDKQKIEKYELGTVYKVKFFESTNAMVFKAQENLTDGVASLAASGAFDNAERTMPISNELNADQARALTGLMVTVKAGSAETPMCIESVDYKAKKVKFRWVPAADITAAWDEATVVPCGGGAAGAPVYSTLVYAQDSYGSIELGGNGRNVEIIINAPGSSGAADPLKQRGTIAWKVKGYCTVILQDDFIVRLESGASA